MIKRDAMIESPAAHAEKRPKRKPCYDPLCEKHRNQCSCELVDGDDKNCPVHGAAHASEQPKAEPWTVDKVDELLDSVAHLDQRKAAQIIAVAHNAAIGVKESRAAHGSIRRGGRERATDSQ